MSYVVYMRTLQDLAQTCPKGKELFDAASGILGYDLLNACINDTEGRLNSTAVSQPAIFVASLAALEKLKLTPEGREAVARCNVAAGLSLGSSLP